MKLATLQDGSRDGLLAVVSRDLTTAHHAAGIATTLQQVLDDWNFRSPPLEDLYATLNGGKARHAFPFDPARCMAPLPRAFQWLEAEAGEHPPRLAQRASDDFLGPTEAARLPGAAADIGPHPGLAAVTGDIEAGTEAETALDGVRLLLLVHGWGTGDPGLPHRAATAFGPVAVTPDELGPAWRGGRIHLPLQWRCRGPAGPRHEAQAAMPCHFGQLIAEAARTRRLRAGSLVGCTLPPRRQDGPPGAPDAAALSFGDTVQLDLQGADGQSVFGAIEQRLRPLHEAADALPGAADGAADALPGAADGAAAALPGAADGAAA